jgi:alpha-mannosidase
MALKLCIDQEDVLLQESKRSADGGAWIVRLFCAAGETRKASLTWTDDTPIKIWRSDLRERPLERLGTQVEVPAWGLVTLRIETLNTSARPQPTSDPRDAGPVFLEAAGTYAPRSDRTKHLDN